MRRDALKILGAVGLQCAFPFEGDELYGQHEHTPEAKAAATPPPAYFKGQDLALLTRVAERIIPGATAAQVPAYIDLVVRNNDLHKKTYADGLAWLRARNFLKLSDAQQLALLEPLCAAVDRGETETPEQKFFRAVKNMTADGFFTSREGLMTYLGYAGNQVLAEFPECTIDEH
jgi:hypothetical protein